MQTLIFIPSRLDSSRLAKKALADIHGKPMVEWVVASALKSAVGDVIVATCGHEIESALKNAECQVILTDPDLPSGTDRVWAAYCALGKPKVDIIIGLQGDLPFFEPSILRDILKPFANPAVDMATLAVQINDDKEITNPNVVKIAMDAPQNGIARAIYFSRAAIPANATIFYHHIGIYAYRPKALETYVSNQPCYLENTERLEQLRFLQHGMRIDVAVVDSHPISVDTQQDLDRVRAFLKNHL